jgi:VIT1/CCC1 family predicted Fe2+/Mn2+ transporter
VPLFPYLLGVPQSLVASIIATASMFFVIGSAKSNWSTTSWWRSGFATLMIGAIAASLAYFTGGLLKSLFG